MKLRLFLCAFIFQNLFSVQLCTAQENNFHNNYTAFLNETIQLNKQLAAIKDNGTLLSKKGLAEKRKNIVPRSPVTILHPENRFISVPGGKLELRIFKPDTIKAVVLSIHGGGWSLGNATVDDVFNDSMARICKVAVVSVNYRLAPENPFPACINDCYSAAAWLIKNSMNEFNTEAVFLSGNSAGAHLAALTAIYIRDSLKAIQKVKGINLIYGCFDLSQTPSLQMATDSTIILSKKYIKENFQLVLPGWSKEKMRLPQYSPLYANLTNLPPALFTIGTKDPLLDDTFFMEARWRIAGNTTCLAVYPESIHAFNFFSTKMAKAANDKIFEWIGGLCSN
jgi:acetyl esterase/lipase